MSGHLPECPAADPVWHPDYSAPCICDALRACEQRVREEESRNVIGSVSLAAIGEANLQQYQLGFSEGLDAAREAVVLVIETMQFFGQDVSYIHPSYFVSAIDNLLEEQK